MRYPTGWLYLAVVIDLYSRAIVGWSMSERMQTSLVNDAWMAAIWQRNQLRAWFGTRIGAVSMRPKVTGCYWRSMVLCKAWVARAIAGTMRCQKVFSITWKRSWFTTKIIQRAKKLKSPCLNISKFFITASGFIPKMGICRQRVLNRG